MRRSPRTAIGGLPALMVGLVLLAAAVSAQAPQCTIEATQRLVASDGAAGDAFGGMPSTHAVGSVYLCDDVIVVGAPYHDDGGTDAGSAYVYRFDGTAWQPEAELRAADAAEGAHFGAAVCVDGDVLIVGAPGDDAAATDAGAAYIFRRGNDGWSQEAKLIVATGGASAEFGYAVAVHTEIVVIGAPRTLSAAGVPGSAYVFRFAGQQWNQETQFASETPVAGDRFGVTVAVDGEFVAVGAPGANMGQGEAYLYHESSGTWTRTARLSPDDLGLMTERFGNAVALSSDAAVIGACGVPEWGIEAACVYRYVEGAWSHEATLTLGPAAPEARFGRSVAVDADAIVVGADLSSDGGTYDGAAYLFRRISGEWSNEARLCPTDMAAGSLFGHAVGLSGAWAVVTAPRDDVVGADSGAACVYHWLVGCPDATDSPADGTTNNTGDAVVGEPPEAPRIACGVGACGGSLLGSLPATLVALGYLKRRARAPRKVPRRAARSQG